MGIKNSIPRLDAVDKVTGAAKYTEDLIPINALVGKTLHSTIANGTVRAIDVDEAWKIPGVVDILTCFDVPDWEYATCGHPLSLDPAHTDVANKRILTKRVRYYGDEIAAVVAESDLAAQKALEAIRVEDEELPPLLRSVGFLCMKNPRIIRGGAWILSLMRAKMSGFIRERSPWIHVSAAMSIYEEQNFMYRPSNIAILKTSVALPI